MGKFSFYVFCFEPNHSICCECCILIANFDSHSEPALNDSHGFSGKGTAPYPNGDTFKGSFVDGVSYKNTIESRHKIKKTTLKQK